MTTTADALEVLTIVSLAHRRTAPRLDDREAALAIATIWAELFSAHNLALPDLIAGVKLRAQHEPDAPEPAEIIKFARKVREDRDPTPEEIARHEAICESKSEDAEELSAIRAARDSSPPVERPALLANIHSLGKSVPDAE